MVNVAMINHATISAIENHTLFYHCLVASNAPLNLYRTLFPVGDVCSPAVLSSYRLVLITALSWDPISPPGPSERIGIVKAQIAKDIDLTPT